MAKKQKYYVVWKGHEPGIYDSWIECQYQIKNYPGAEYKSFSNKDQASEAFDGNYKDHVSSKSKPTFVDHTLNEKIIKDSIAVDAACSGNPGDMEYRGVDTFNKAELFRQGPFAMGTNNIGEFLAIVHGLAMLQKENKPHTSIYTDSRTAISWVKHKRTKTKLTRTSQNEVLFVLISRAEKWLQNNSFSNPLVKWETKLWGEIPADFGRK